MHACMRTPSRSHLLPLVVPVFHGSTAPSLRSTNGKLQEHTSRSKIDADQRDTRASSITHEWAMELRKGSCSGRTPLSREKDGQHCYLLALSFLTTNGSFACRDHVLLYLPSGLHPNSWLDCFKSLNPHLTIERMDELMIQTSIVQRKKRLWTLPPKFNVLWSDREEHVTSIISQHVCVHLHLHLHLLTVAPLSWHHTTAPPSRLGCIHLSSWLCHRGNKQYTLWGDIPCHRMYDVSRLFIVSWIFWYAV